MKRPSIELFGRRCRVIPIEGLIRAKESLGRPKDVLGAQELRAILEQKKCVPAERDLMIESLARQ